MRKMLWSFLLVLVLAPAGWANNLRITNVSLEDRNAAATSVVVEFDIDWDNSWRNTTNHDAVWVVLKVSYSAAAYACHADMETAGLNPTGTSPGTNTDLDIYVPADKTGAFIRRKSTGSGTASSKNVRLMFDYTTATGISDITACTAGAATAIQIKVVGVEMVYIPTGAFDAGDAPPDTTTGSVSTFWFTTGGASRPWHFDIDPTVVTFAAGNTGNYYYTAVPTTIGTGNREVASGTTLKLPPSFPKGYLAFYSMKYEITEGLYVEFENLNGTSAADFFDITCSAPLGKATNTVSSRNYVLSTTSACVGGPFMTKRPDRTMGFLNWKVFAAMMDWLALRPMTELEYEKMARGPVTPVSGEFAWGNAASIRPFSVFAGSPEDGTETQVAGGEGNIVFGPTLSQGDSFLGHNVGPIRAGIFATSSSTRVTAGAGYYGNMELSGSQWEYVVSVGTEWGLYLSSSANLFDGTHGDGDITSSGAAGRQYWPGAQAASPYYVLYATGTGLRGAGWNETSPHRARISDRYYAGLSSMAARSDWGGRGVRTYDGTDF